MPGQPVRVPKTPSRTDRCTWRDRSNQEPLPLLVVEVLSGITRRRDLGSKRSFYIDLGIPDYWVVDGTARTIRSIRPGADDIVVSDVLSWHPAKAAERLTLDIAAMFREALGG